MNKETPDTRILLLEEGTTEDGIEHHANYKMIGHYPYDLEEVVQEWVKDVDNGFTFRKYTVIDEFDHRNFEIVGEKPVGIRELQTRRMDLREKYHEEDRVLKDQIAAIRKKRGTKLKTYNDIPIFEPGRDREPRNGNW